MATVGGDKHVPLLVLDLGLDVVNRVRRLDLQRNCLPSKRLHENLHTPTQPEDEVERRLLLDVVVGQGAAVLELLASEDETLLVGRNTLLVLNLGLDVIDRVGRLDFKRDCLARQCLDEDLHSTTETKDCGT